MRRWLLPAVLGLLAAAFSVLAVRSAQSPAGGAPAEATVPIGVLSLRRAPAVVAATVADARLRADLESVLASPDLGDAEHRSCVIVEDGERVVYALRPDVAVVPASTLKVLTGFATIERLGATTRLETEVRAAAAPVGGVVEGQLWLVGGGDPLLATGEYAATLRNQPPLTTPLERLADAVVAAGVREVRGGIAGDDSRYDAVHFVPSWKQGYLVDNEISPVAGLVVNDNFERFAGGRRQPAADPATHGAEVLTGLLRARGVVVGAAPVRDVAPEGATVLATLASPPVADIAAQMLRESDNLTAEMLVKELGYRFGGAGSWDAGLKVLRDHLAAAGLAVDHLVQHDGSGLERENRLSCSLLLDAIDLAGPDGPLAQGFPVAGESGTLADRFTGSPARGRVRAKTGSLDHVAGLVGWADTGHGTLDFALVGNGLPRGARFGRLLQERVAEVLVRYPQAPPVADLGVAAAPLPPGSPGP